MSGTARLEMDHSVDELAANGLAEQLRGQLLRPADVNYPSARQIWNALVDRHPRFIARCAGVADVRAALQFACDQGLPLSVKGGGHGVAGKAMCDGMVIDLSPMQGIRVDPVQMTARAEGGVTWGDFDAETQSFALATTGGVIPSTGIAGLTLGGGFGFLARRFGLSCDNLLEADVVLANGSWVSASETAHPDLFWALRGGGGNFGVVTSFKYQLHPVGPMVLGGFIVHPLSAAREAIRFYREFTASAPDEAATYLGLAIFPDGEPVVAFVAGYSGPLAEGERALKPLRSFGTPLADLVQPMPYTALQGLFAPTYPAGRRNYWKGSFLDGLDDAAIDVLVERFANVPSPYASIGIEHLGGAVARVDATATAFAERSAPYHALVVACWDDPADTERNVQWARETWDALRPWMKDSVYINYVDAGEEDSVRAAYGSNYDRLARVKAVYDPENVFRSNHNVLPAAASTT